MKRFLKRRIPYYLLNILRKKHITYANDLLYTYHNADFIREPRFAEAYRLCKEVGGEFLKDYDIQWRVHVLGWAASHAKHLEGDFVDCGVHTGFFARAVIHYVDFATLHKKYYLMDTFSGMDPKYSSEYEMKRDEKLGYKKQKNLYEQVKKTFEGFDVVVIKGPIPETLPLAQPKKVSFLSIDMNAVVPEVAALEYFWERTVNGGIVVLDDYGYPGCIEQKLAHDEFARSKGVEILSLPTGQGMIIRP